MATQGIGLLREQEVFVVKETTPGTIAYPTAGDYIVAAGMATIKQTEAFEDSPKIYNSRDITDVCQNQTPPGEWMIPVLLQPSGVAGTPPAEAALMEGWLGKQTIVTNTSVTYSQTIEKPAYTIWVRSGHTVFHGIGGTVNAPKVTFDSTCQVKADFQGQFMQMGWAGSSQLSATASIGATTTSVDDAKLYTVGAKIYFVTADGTTTDNNTSSGYTVTGVNSTSNVVTFTPATSTAFAVDDWVKGFLPTGVEVGTGPVKARTGIVSIDAVNIKTRSFSINSTDNVKYLDDERTDSGYPESYVEGTRNITGDMSLYFRAADLAYYQDARDNEYKVLAFNIGNTAGSLIEFEMLRTQIEMPEIENADPTLGIKANYRSIGTSGEDSMTVAYT